MRAGACLRAMWRDEDTAEADVGWVLAGEVVCKVIALVDGFAKKS